MARHLSACLLLVGVVAGLVAGCGGPDESLLGNEDVPTQRADEQAIMDQQAQAVADHSLVNFMASVDRTDKAFAARERRLFRNLSQLPLEKFGYTVLDRTWPDTLVDPAWGKNVRLPEVLVTTQLEGFDQRPVQQVTGFAFAEKDDSLLLVSDRTRTGDVFPGSHPAPWDLTKIHVKSSYDVLAIFDDAMWPKAQQISDAVQQGIWDDDSVLPFTWSDRVVVYAVDNKAVLGSFDAVPGGDINHVGALTFPVYSDVDRRVPAGTRFIVLPSSVNAGEPFMGETIRHEISHVAIGTRDDGDPRWVSEGIAEYLGAHPLSRNLRRIPTIALGRAQQGATSMPDSQTFNGPDAEWNYALSWMAIDYIAATQGESKIWALMDALHNGGSGTTDANQDTAVRRVLGFDSHELARRAAARIVQLYG